MKKSRNVFISFLGTNPYSASRYVGKDPEVDMTTRFVQVATLKSVAHHFGPGDKVYIFTTTGALKNWNDQPIPGTNNEMDARLHSELRELEIDSDIENIHVEDGQTQEELWAIFTTIFDVLEDGDNLFFDITHGFRSLPLLMLVLINYAKFLKNVTVSGIFYGAYDKNRWESPIWNLTDFSKLQDWTNNANIFLRTGNAKGLVKQIKGDTLKDVKVGLERFSEFTLVNRGMDIYKGDEIIKLSQNLNTIGASDNPADKAAEPIFKKVRDTFEPYKKDSSINGFHAVRWCIDNGLIQQAATLLEEFIITYLMDLIGIPNKTSSVTRSVILSFAKSGPAEYRYGTRPDYSLEKEKKICDDLFKIEELSDIGAIAKDISNSVRNDVNHAGFRKSPGPKSYMDIRTITIEQFNKLCDVLATRGHQIEKIIEG
ncbi:TIGR02221 family CRISPR-associated protein [Neolewinella lacunae]|uniref:TIGR02221 family CRISPR-associated protein n=1 Tax=Neolewinella lacunae TaxID=1517758 RepID=A0A923PKX4_9BACT|nr:TIGR02221 family CRISPR-associated protein [Neolewinella lacunae]MBC6995249.1 TIGR02221 family CRISPR-associated protein [Neolewinella lacunae]MDN3635442.1 TIGR02221 family CRISPR-associated protein [Neolewinella lacunae]